MLSTFSNIFSSEITGSTEAKFHVDCGASLGWGNEILFKWSWSMPIYGKNLKKSSSPESKDYAALGAKVLPSLFKW